MLVKERKRAAIQTEEGAGVRVRRLFPVPEMNHYDPFVLFDEFFLGPSVGFPLHPHRGFEAITYMLEGVFHHRDIMGNDTTITQGGVQYFSAGRGLMHSEMPGTRGMNHGIQLWVNLPKRLKNMNPSYNQVDPEKLPVAESSDAIIRTIVGKGSPVRLHSDITYLDVIVKTKGTFFPRITADIKGFVYVISGSVKINDEVIDPEEAFLFDTLRNFQVTAIKRSRFLLVAGKPHGEPIHMHGSFVD